MNRKAIDAGHISGLVCLAISVCFQCVCLFITRVVSRTDTKSRTVVLRMWIHLSAALDQLTFFVFHFKYNIVLTDFDDSSPCVILRFLSSFTSTFLMMWFFVLAGFYMTMTIKPAKCYSFHAQFLSHCTTWVWTCTSCLLYLIMAKLIKTKYSLQFIDNCWNDITGKIHFYSTHGNEVIPFVCAVVFAAMARFRLPKYRHLFLLHTSKEPAILMELANLKVKVNCVLVLCAAFFSYYVALVFRYVVDEQGSDCSLMILQSLKGFAVGILLCICDPRIVEFFNCRGETREQHQTTRNGITVTREEISTAV